MARSGQRRSHRPQPVQALSSTARDFSPGTTNNAPVGQNVAHIPQPLHQSVFMLIVKHLVLIILSMPGGGTRQQLEVENTYLCSTMGALDTAVLSGRALYAGISNYPADETRQAAGILKDLGTPCLINQVPYNMQGFWGKSPILCAPVDRILHVNPYIADSWYFERACSPPFRGFYDKLGLTADTLNSAI